MSWDQVWEKVFQENEWGKYPDESFIRFVARNFYKKERAQVKILEVGCGPGANIWYMAREGFIPYGIDGSPTAIDKGRKRLQAEGLKAHMDVGDIVSLPYENDFFDGIGDNECLAHNSRAQMDKIFKEIKRVLKPGGLFYSRTFTDKVYVGRTRKEVGKLEYKDVSDGPFGGRGFIRLVSEEDIKNMYGRFFDILSVDRRDYTDSNQTVTISEWVIVCRK